MEFTYDAANQLIQKVLKDATGALTETVTFAYDALGNLAPATDSDSAFSFTYDALGRLTQAATGATIAQPATAIGYAYDHTGNRLTMTDPEGGLTSSSLSAVKKLQNRLRILSWSAPSPGSADLQGVFFEESVNLKGSSNPRDRALTQVNLRK